jgi:hypothetical protein
VAEILSTTGGGIYNAPINYRATDWSDANCILVRWRGDLANWDFPGLAILLCECHRRMVRVAVEPCNCQHIRLRFFQRHTREGSTPERLPDLAEIDRLVHGWYS